MGTEEKTQQGVVVVDNQDYIFTARHSRRARRITVRLRVWEGLEVVLPWRTRLADALVFLRRTAPWWIPKLTQYKEKQKSVVRCRLESGETILCLQKPYELDIDIDSLRSRSRVREDGSVLRIAAQDHQGVAEALQRWYRKQARYYFEEVARYYAAEIGESVGMISVGNQRSQWGSCTPRRCLCFNWRLMLSTEPIARYVAIHEVAHLRHRNHGADFWRLVAQLDPLYKEHRRWLRTNAHHLVL